MRTGKTRGFTFVEMIVAIVIAASLSAAVYSTFAQGVRLWTRASKDRGEWKADLWGEKMTEDIRNAFWDNKHPFNGTRTEFSLSTLIQDSKGASLGGSPVYAHYVFDPTSFAVGLRQNSFEGVLMSRPVSKTSISVLEGVAGFELQYYGYDAKMKAYRWESRWNKDCFPEAVKITIESKQANQSKWVRMITIPTEIACLA